MRIYNVMDGEKIIGIEIADGENWWFYDFDQSFYKDMRLGRFPRKSLDKDYGRVFRIEYPVEARMYKAGKTFNIFWGRLQNRLKKSEKFVAFWIWRKLAGGKEAFYQSPKLAGFKTNMPPNASDWFGLKLWAWSKAVAYLVSIGELTHTPTLSGKF